MKDQILIKRGFPKGRKVRELSARSLQQVHMLISPFVDDLSFLCRLGDRSLPRQFDTKTKRGSSARRVRAKICYRFKMDSKLNVVSSDSTVFKFQLKWLGYFLNPIIKSSSKSTGCIDANVGHLELLVELFEMQDKPNDKKVKKSFVERGKTGDLESVSRALGVYDLWFKLEANFCKVYR